MPAIAQERLQGHRHPVEFQVLDAHSKPTVASEGVDLYPISLRLNICERSLVLQEAMRILSPGGRLVILEASNFPRPWLHRLYLLLRKISSVTLQGTVLFKQD